MYRLKTIVLFTNSSANAQSPSRQLYSPTFPSSLPSLLPLLTSCISPSLHSSLLHSLPDRVPMFLPSFLAPRRTRTSASMFPCYPEISTRIRAQRIFSLRIFFACCSSLPPQPVLVMYLVGNKVVNNPFLPLLVVCSNAASSFPPLLQRCLFVSSSSPTLPFLLSSLPLPFLFSCPTPHAFLGCNWHSALSPLLFLLEVPLLLEASASAAFGCCMARKHARVLMCLCV